MLSHMGQLSVPTPAVRARSADLHVWVVAHLCCNCVHVGRDLASHQVPGALPNVERGVQVAVEAASAAALVVANPEPSYLSFDVVAVLVLESSLHAIVSHSTAQLVAEEAALARVRLWDQQHWKVLGE